MAGLALRQVFAILSGLVFSAVTLGSELPGSLKSGISQSFSNFHYSAYCLTADTNKPFRITLRSKAFDAFLLAISPDGSALINDDHELLDDPKLASNDAALVIAKPGIGRWLVLATTLRSGGDGEFVLATSGPVTADACTPSLEDRGLIAAAFAARQVVDPNQRRDALFDELTLPSFRLELKQRLQTEIAHLEGWDHGFRTKLEANRTRQEMLRELLNSSQSLDSSNPILNALVIAAQNRTDAGAARFNDALIESGRRRLAISRALDELAQFNALSKTLQVHEEALFRGDSPSLSLEEQRSAIIRLRSDRDAVGRALAEKLIASSLVTVHRFNLFSSQTAETYRVFGNLVSNFSTACRDCYPSWETRTPAVFQFDPEVWLPTLLPWPPPIPSSHLVLDRRLLDHGAQLLHTFGDIETELHNSLSRAGYSGESFWGVPNGFAIVTPLEQTDADGRPLSGPARWASRIAEMKQFSLAEYIRALFTAPPGYFRVLVFVVSPDAFAPAGSRELLETLQRWSSEGRYSLPDSVRSIPLSNAHRITVLVYEFFKLHDTDQPATAVPGRLKAPDHLRATQLAAWL
jgi:hypothetical protein